MKTVTPKEISRFIRLSVLGVEYNMERKQEYHKLGKKICKAIADKLGLVPVCYDIRSNMGGIAVSGEITLHSEKLYIQFSLSCISSLRTQTMWRTCEGRKDYSGGTNRWFLISELDDLDKLCERFRPHLSQ